MKKIFFFLLAAAVLNGAPWRESKSFTLKKDQFAKVMVKGGAQERLLSFRWTLYTDKALVVHENFDRFVGQHTLYLGHNQSFRKRLLSAKNSEKDVPYVVVLFKKFDEASKSAQFDLLLFDKENRIVLDYLTKEEK